jgi:hypothetical protein
MKDRGGGGVQNLITLCCAKHIDVWKINSNQILKYIKSNKYTLIVPKLDLELFKKNTPEEYQVYSEDIYLSKSVKILLNKKCKNISRRGWYLQQFIKIASLRKIKNEDIFVIWDSDNIPLKKIFFKKKKKILFYKSEEHHLPYFDFIRKVFKIEKKTKNSFVAQCLPCKGKWINNFFKYIEKNYNENWEDVFINNINFHSHSAFSEYETLGTFFYENFHKEMKFLKNNYQRYGYSEIKSLNNFFINEKRLSKKYDFISFENWEDRTLFFRLKLYLKYFFSYINLAKNLKHRIH